MHLFSLGYVSAPSTNEMAMIGWTRSTAITSCAHRRYWSPLKSIDATEPCWSSRRLFRFMLGSQSFQPRGANPLATRTWAAASLGRPWVGAKSLNPSIVFNKATKIRRVFDSFDQRIWKETWNWPGQSGKPVKVMGSNIHFKSCQDVPAKTTANPESSSRQFGKYKALNRTLTENTCFHYQLSNGIHHW